jgi:hypothetical protein
MLRSHAARKIRGFLPFAIWFACACNVGAPLVDRVQGKLGVDGVACNPSPPCEPLSHADPRALIRRALQIVRDDCIAARRDSGISCDSSEGDAGASDPTDQTPGCEDQHALTELPAQLSCDDVVFASRSDAPDLSLDGVNWLHSNLTISASAARRIALTNATLRSVFIRLEGPVLLHIEHSESLRDLRIAGTVTPAGTPALELVQANGDALTIGDMTQSFTGSVTLRDVQLFDSVVSSTQLDLESVASTQVYLAAQSLTASDLDVLDAVIDADSMLISAFTAKQSQLHWCTGATLVAARISESSLSACDDGGAIRLYDSTILSSAIDGRVESDTSQWENDRLGATAKSEVVLFQTNFSAISFCKRTSKVAIGEASEIRCSFCEREFSEPAELCTIPTQSVVPTFESNYCPLLTGTPTAPPACTDPVPERVRPPIHPI